MRTSLLSLAAACLLACGGPPRTAPAPGGHGPTASSSAGPTLAGKIPIAADDEVFGPAFSPDGASVLLAAAGRLYRYDPKTLAELDARPIATTPRLRGAAVVLRGARADDAAFEAATGAQIVVEAPPGYECEGTAFSADAARLSRNCRVGDDEMVVIQDARTGAVITQLSEFRTAAPVRAGAITDSGNFVFWWARASGGFEDIARKGTGPVLSSHSVMSPDGRAVFTVSDKDWMPDDRTPARVLDPKSWRTTYTLPFDIDRVYFSPDSRRFAAVHLGDDREVTAVTIHDTADGALVGRLGDRDVELIAFSPDARSLVVRGGGALRLYTDIP